MIERPGGVTKLLNLLSEDNSPQSIYRGIANPGLRRFLEAVEPRIQGMVATRTDGLFPASDLSWEFSLLTGLERWGVSQLYDRVRETGIIDFSVKEYSRNKRYFLDQDGLRIFAALCWNVAIHSNPARMIKRDSLQALVSRVRKAIDKDPLGRFLHDPLIPTPSGIKKDGLGEKKRKEPSYALTIEGVEERVDRERHRLTKLSERAPKLNEEQLSEVKKLHRQELAELWRKVASDLDEVSYVCLGIPFEVAQVVMFIVAANLAALGQPENYDSQLSLLTNKELKTGLSICLGYLDEYKKITSLLGLFRAVQRKVIETEKSTPTPGVEPGV